MMACKYDPTIQPNIRRLITSLSTFKEGSDVFKYVYTFFVQTLERADSTFCITRPEIDKQIAGLSEKFMFHGFLHESNMLQAIYTKYMGVNPTEQELNQKLAIIKFLILLSKSPTTYFASQMKSYESKVIKDKEEKIDWGAYLREGIEEWKPNFDESDSFSDTDEENDGDTSSTDKESETLVVTVKEVVPPSSTIVPVLPSPSDTEAEEIDYDTILRSKIQSGWFKSAYLRDLPSVSNPEANIAVRWESYLSEVSHGLLGTQKSRLISEYKVIREVLWQFMQVHNSVVFSWVSNDLKIKEGISIASLRPFVFKMIVESFIPDILMMHKLRTFHQHVMEDDASPHTYRGYAEALMSIVQVAMNSIIELEREVAKQQITMTLIKLGNHLNGALKNIKYLYQLHQSATLDCCLFPADECCVNLLAKLYQEMYVVYEKYQMDICLTLYMEAVYKYVRIIEEWFRTDQLYDAHREFPIQCVKNGGHSHRSMNHTQRDLFETNAYILRDSCERFTEYPLMQLIRKEVVQFGRQIHLLSLLRQLHLLHETNFSIYDEWKQAVFASIRQYFNTGKETVVMGETKKPPPVVNKSPKRAKPNMMCRDYCKYITELDALDNLINIADREMMVAFGDYVRPTMQTNDRKLKGTYEFIKRLTKNNFPGLQHILADAFNYILLSKYQKCGVILKNVFKGEFCLGEHFDLLGKIFLFKGDVIFPFYRRVFEKIENNCNWGNDIWLTYDLQDVLMDIHPKFYENVIVTVKDGWQHLLEDPLKTCTLINVQYKILWPIDVIVTSRCEKMYKELFYFILKIKWALYTLNHMQYSRLEKKQRQKAPKCVKILLQRLEVLRFGFINIFAALQHYILGYVYQLCAEKFTADFDNATDLESLIDSHKTFIYSFHRLASRVRDYKTQSYGVYMALYLVRQLRSMWLNPGDINDKALRKNEEGLTACHRNIFDVISIQVYD